MCLKFEGNTLYKIHLVNDICIFSKLLFRNCKAYFYTVQRYNINRYLKAFKYIFKLQGEINQNMNYKLSFSIISLKFKLKFNLFQAVLPIIYVTL